MVVEDDPKSHQSWKSGGSNQKEVEMNPDKVEPGTISQKQDASELAKAQESQKPEVVEKPAPEEVQDED